MDRKKGENTSEVYQQIRGMMHRMHVYFIERKTVQTYIDIVFHNIHLASGTFFIWDFGWGKIQLTTLKLG